MNPEDFGQFVNLLLPRRRGYLAMLAAYLDASGVTNSEKHFVMAGFVAPIDKWVRFESDWQVLLNEPEYAALLPERKGNRYAHAKKLATWKSGIRQKFYMHTHYLLKQTVSFAVGITFKHSHYEAAYKDYPLTQKDSRYGMGFRAALVTCCKTVNEQYQNEPLAFVIEHGDPNQGAAKKIFNLMSDGAKMLDDIRKQYNVTTLTIGFKQDWGALQVADMHAYTLLKHLKSPLGPRTGKSNRYFGDINLLLSGLMHAHFVIDKSDILDQRRILIYNNRKRKEYGKQIPLTSFSVDGKSS